jgi:hypothetical protein
MEVSLRMPASKRALLATQCSLLTGTIRASTLFPDAWLLAAVRRLTGTSQFPMGQKFLEKALLTFKRAMGKANPRCRTKMIENLVINEMVRGQAQRKWATQQLAGGRRYLHINNSGDVEPCAFCQLSTDNIKDKSLLEVLRSSPLLAAIRRRQALQRQLSAAAYDHRQPGYAGRGGGGGSAARDVPRMRAETGA